MEYLVYELLEYEASSTQLNFLIAKFERKAIYSVSKAKRMIKMRKMNANENANVANESILLRHLKCSTKNIQTL